MQRLPKHIVVFLILLVSLCTACQSNPSPEIAVVKNAETTQITTQVTTQPTTISRTISFSKDSYGLGDSQEECIEYLGMPDRQESALGVIKYSYSNPKYTELFFLNNRLIIMESESKDFLFPKDIRVGDTIYEALKTYSLTQSLLEEGINGNLSDEELKKRLSERSDKYLSLEIEKDFIAYIAYDRTTFKITSIKVSKYSPQKLFLKQTPEDLVLDFEGITDKYGMPTDVIIYEDEALDLNYSTTEENFVITMISIGKEIKSSLSYRHPKTSNYSLFNDLKIGDDIIPIIKTHGIPENAYNLVFSDGVPNEYLKAKLSYYGNEPIMRYIWEDVVVELILDENKLQVVGWEMRLDESIDCNLAQLPNTYKQLNFDPEKEIIAKDFWDIGVGQTRKEVFENLGKPIHTYTDFDDFYLKSQRWLYEEGEVFFYQVEDYDNFDTGNTLDYIIKTPRLMGPRGIRVGNAINSILDVIPGKNKIDFKTLKEDVVIYPDPLTDAIDSSSAIVRPYLNKSNSGIIFFRVDWALDMEVRYEEGIITEICVFPWLN